MWWKDLDGQYVNGDHITALYASEDSPGVWVIKGIYANVSYGSTVTQLSGTWSSLAAAQEAIRELVDGNDPATFGD